MFTLRSILIKLKSIHRWILTVTLITLTTGCALIWEVNEEKVNYRSTSNNMKIITLPNGLSAAVYQFLDRETPNNAFAKQPHTMGDVISGKIICDNEFIDHDTDATEQKCRIIIDTTDRGVGG